MAEDLTSFLETVAPTVLLRVEEDLGDGFVVLRRDEAERRQAAQDVRSSEDIVIELLRNARDAGATRIFLATTLEGRCRNIVVLDNGCGIPQTMHERIFDPRVTSKLDSVHIDRWGIHGRGMALYSIRENCLTARVCGSAPHLGTSIATTSSLDSLPEKADQSSFPTFTLEEDGKVKIGGPKNILRTAAEFALEHRGQVSVYVGSYSEIAASLIASAMRNYSLAELSLLPDTQTVPFIDLPAFSHSPNGLAELLESLGLSMSSRTARRILDGDIKPVDPLHEVIRARLVVPKTQAASTASVSKPARLKAKAHVRIRPEDLREFATSALKSYEPIAETYYLESQVSPQATVKRGRLVLTVPLVPREQ